MNRSYRLPAGFTLLVLGLLCLRPHWIVPDSVGTFVWLRSAVIDHDLHFMNEWSGLGLQRDGYFLFKEVTPLGTLANHWWVGSSVIAGVPYLLAHLTANIWPRLGEGGFSGIYTWSIAWTNVLCLGVVWWSVGRLAGIRRASDLAFASVLLGTPLFFYAFLSPLTSHLFAAAVIAIACVLVAAEERSGAYEWGFGLALGLAVAVRLQHVLTVPALLLAFAAARPPVRSWMRVAAGLALGGALQAAAWYSVYGTPFGAVTTGAAPGGGTWSAFQNAAFLEVLFSSWRGLFIWSPVTLLCIHGIVVAARFRDEERVTERRLATAFAAVLVAQWIANGWLDRFWWGGLSFGPRRWVDLAPLLIVGLLWSWQSSRISRLLTPLAVVWSLLLTAAAAAGRLDLDHFVGFGDLWSAAGAGLRPDSWRAIFAAEALSWRGVVAAVAGLGCVTVFGVLARMLARSRRVAAAAAGVIVLTVAVALTSMSVATRERAPYFVSLFGVQPQRAPLGALMDRRALISRELEWRERTGSSSAARVRSEVEQLDREIALRLRGHLRGASGGGGEGR